MNLYVTEYGIATQRLCFQRGPDDNEERCAYTVWNYKKVYMCLCYGDLCNGMKTTIASSFLITLSVCLIRWLIWGCIWYIRLCRMDEIEVIKLPMNPL